MGCAQPLGGNWRLATVIASAAMSSALSQASRSKLGARVALGWFAFSVALLVWPIYPWLGDHVEPRVFGLPWSLCWVLLVIAANFVVLSILYRFRVVDDRELPDPPSEGPP